jgi:hypothetical protein
MELDKKTQRLFDKELKIPCHLNHIADRIFKLSKEQTLVIINEMILNGILEESCFVKNYYKIKENV